MHVKLARAGLTQASQLLTRYGSLAQAAPVRTGSATLSLLAGLGDVTAQHLEQRRCEESFTFDWTRFVCLVSYAAVWNGPVNTKLYTSYVRLFGDGNLRSVAKAMAMDQLVYMPFLAIPISFAFKDSITNGRFAPIKVWESLVVRWKSAVVGCWAVFLPLEFINLYYVPLRFRVAMSGLMSVCWMTVLSNAQSGRLRDHRADEAKNYDIAFDSHSLLLRTSYSAAAPGIAPSVGGFASLILLVCVNGNDHPRSASSGRRPSINSPPCSSTPPTLHIWRGARGAAIHWAEDEARADGRRLDGKAGMSTSTAHGSSTAPHASSVQVCLLQAGVGGVAGFVGGYLVKYSQALHVHCTRSLHTLHYRHSSHCAHTACTVHAHYVHAACALHTLSTHAELQA